jgi:tRNA (cmo5U34)-methyltransferase
MPRLCRGHAWRVTTSWKDASKVEECTGRVGRLAARQAGEAELVEALPDTVERILDLGCGDGRLVSLVLAARPELTEAIGLDNSPPMLGEIHELLRAA